MIAPFALSGARVFTGDEFLDDYAVLVDGARIQGIVPSGSLPQHTSRQELGGGLLVPGFIDAQVNGGAGVLFNATRTPAGVEAIAAAHARFGSTGLLPTFITDMPQHQAEAVAAIHACRGAGMMGILGIHLEGPFLAPSRKGAHDPALLRPLTDTDVDGLLRTGLETVVVTLAPEMASLPQIERLTEGGVIVSLGHSDASLDMALGAAHAGARGVTHLFNAMSQLSHRAPGLVGAAMLTGRLWAGLIADGHHVHPAALRLALRAKQGPGRLFLVSDAMPPAGSACNRFELNGREVTRRDGRLTLEDGTLAGSDLTMDRAVRYVVGELRQPLGEALRMASLYPARFLRLDRERGRLAAGFVADMVHLSDDLAVRRVWTMGVERA